MPNVEISRRKFLSAVAGTVAVASVPGLGRLASAEQHGVTFVAAANGIHAMEKSGSGWRQRSFTAAEAPQALVVSTSARWLYVANAIEQYGTAPTGAVTAYRITPHRTLHKVAAAPLALAAIRPYVVAVSPDGTLLAAGSEGGIVSLLTIRSDGSPGAVVAVHKTLTSKPQELEFVADGLLRVRNRDAERLFRVSPEEGFALVSSGPCVRSEPASLDNYGVVNAKAIACLRA